MKKEEALEYYDDSIASGKSAVMLKENEKDNLEINCGNIKPDSLVMV